MSSWHRPGHAGLPAAARLAGLAEVAFALGAAADLAFDLPPADPAVSFSIMLNSSQTRASAISQAGQPSRAAVLYRWDLNEP
jgi:hypothetical protein